MNLKIRTRGEIAKTLIYKYFPKINAEIAWAAAFYMLEDENISEDEAIEIATQC